MTETYKLTIEGAGLNLVREVPKLIGDKVVLLVLKGDAGVSDLDEPLTSSAAIVADEVRRGSADSAERAGKGRPKLSIREFLNEHDPKRSPDKIATIGTYLKDHDGKDTFTRKDLEKGFEDAAESVPGNLPRDVNWAVKAGWIARKSGAAGVYYVTHSGSEAVSKKFPRDLLKKTAVVRPTKKVCKKGCVSLGDSPWQMWTCEHLIQSPIEF